MTNVVIGTNGDTQTVIIEDTPKGASSSRSATA